MAALQTVINNWQIASLKQRLAGMTTDIASTTSNKYRSPNIATSLIGHF
jgi:hypothetical protein